jgi:hypothetical protein
MKKKSILKILEGGDRRSIGRADEVATMVQKNPRLFGELLRKATRSGTAAMKARGRKLLKTFEI